VSAGKAIGPYQIIEKLGAGGMGEVYKAQDARVGRQVALKILPQSLATDNDRRRRFEQEARLAAALNHPNIMAIYDVGLDAHPPYIVAELVAGESLRSIIERGPLAPKKAIDIAAQVAAGLSAAHGAGIVHRDLKPENVMLTPNGTAKILDFGVARMQPKAISGDQTATLSHTAAGAVVGTAAYMSPEQARALDVDHRADQFSLGLVLYEMLSGRQAFARPSAVQTMSAIVEDEPPLLERPIPSQLRWLLERCLAKEREARYESTQDLARELAQLRDHFNELTAATGSAHVAAVGGPRRRVPVAALAFGMIGAALAAWSAARLATDARAVDMSQYRFTPFATALAEQFTPAWSPDGKSIAFLGRQPAGRLELYVQGVDAPSATAISGGDAEVYQSANLFWSPDSRSIFYRCGMSGKWGLCRIPAGGGASVLIQENEISGTISPDGRTVVTFTHPPDAKVWIISPIGSAPRAYEPEPVKISSYYNTPSLAFAPDGTSIMFGVALTGRGETSWLLPWPPGPSHRVFPQTTDFSSTPQWKWLPDSRHLLFADSWAGASSRAYLYMADLSGNAYWPALAQDRAAGNPSVSADGSRVAYVSDLSHSDVIAVPLGEGPPRTLLASTRSYQMANVSPNGQLLVYVTNQRGTPEVWISSLAEGWQRPLVSPADFKSDGETAQFFMTPVFSPDGRRVAVVAKLSSVTRILTVFTSGGAPVEATAEKRGFEMTPAWSPDGNWIVYTSLQGLTAKLMKVRPGSGEAPVELGDYSGPAVPSWSPAGDWIATHRPSDGKTLLLSPDGKTVREISRDLGPVAWSRDGKKLYQVQTNPPVLVEFDVTTGKARKLRDLGELAPYSSVQPGLVAAVMPDGKSIMYTVNRPRQEIWILDGVAIPQSWWHRLLRYRTSPIAAKFPKPRAARSTKAPAQSGCPKLKPYVLSTDLGQK
jgi:eukaryotic-like serine/threonine-protein kinase